MSRVDWSVLFVSALLTLCITLPTVAQSDANEVQKLLASDGKAGDDFGRSVAVQDTIAFVGAQRVDIGANTDQGQVYIYELINGTRTEVAFLLPDELESFDTFGEDAGAVWIDGQNRSHEFEL